jgi:hypothetical protein
MAALSQDIIITRPLGRKAPPAVGSPVDFTYQPPFAFKGNIEKVAIDLK